MLISGRLSMSSSKSASPLSHVTEDIDLSACAWVLAAIEEYNCVMLHGWLPQAVGGAADMSADVDGTVDISANVDGTVDISANVDGTAVISANVDGTVDMSADVDGTLDTSAINADSTDTTASDLLALTVEDT